MYLNFSNFLGFAFNLYLILIVIRKYEKSIDAKTFLQNKAILLYLVIDLLEG